MNCKICEYCREPNKFTFLVCTKAEKPICGNEYLFSEIINSPDWCPLTNKVGNCQ